MTSVLQQIAVPVVTGVLGFALGLASAWIKRGWDRVDLRRKRAEEVYPALLEILAEIEEWLQRCRAETFSSAPRREQSELLVSIPENDLRWSPHVRSLMRDLSISCNLLMNILDSFYRDVEEEPDHTNIWANDSINKRRDLIQDCCAIGRRKINVIVSRTQQEASQGLGR